MNDDSGFLLHTAIRRFDAVAARHERRDPPGSADMRLLASRRRLLVDRARAAEWRVPDARVRQIIDAIAGIETAADPVDEAEQLDRFALVILSALERRSADRRARGIFEHEVSEPDALQN